MDRIADGLEMEDESVLVCRDGWFEGFLDSLTRWRRLVQALLADHHKELDTPLEPNPATERQREALLALHHDTLIAYGPAWQEDWFFTADWDGKGEAARELLKRYRMFTRYVCGFCARAPTPS